MIIKYRNEYGRWGWISGVEALHDLGDELTDHLMSEYDWEYNIYGREGEGKPHVYEVEKKSGKPRLMAFYTDEMYLTDSTNGSTIEILVHKNS